VPAEGRAMAHRSGELCVSSEISSGQLELLFKIKMKKKTLKREENRFCQRQLLPQLV